MPRKAVIAVVGSGRESEPDISHARALGKSIAENDWVLITGGRNAGVMKAANQGAKEMEGSLTIGILPDREADVSPEVDVAIVTDMGQARNNIIVLSADVVIACGVVGPGTASEVSLAIKSGKPVILVAAPDHAKQFFETIGKAHIHFASAPDEAIRLVHQLLSQMTSVTDSRRKPDM